MSSDPIEVDALREDGFEVSARITPCRDGGVWLELCVLAGRRVRFTSTQLAVLRQRLADVDGDRP